MRELWQGTATLKGVWLWWRQVFRLWRKQYGLYVTRADNLVQGPVYPLTPPGAVRDYYSGGCVSRETPASLALAAAGNATNYTRCPPPVCVESLLVTVRSCALFDTVTDSLAMFQGGASVHAKSRCPVAVTNHREHGDLSVCARDLSPTVRGALSSK